MWSFLKRLRRRNVQPAFPVEAITRPMDGVAAVSMLRINAAHFESREPLEVVAHHERLSFDSIGPYVEIERLRLNVYPSPGIEQVTQFDRCVVTSSNRSLAIVDSNVKPAHGLLHIVLQDELKLGEYHSRSQQPPVIVGNRRKQALLLFTHPREEVIVTIEQHDRRHLLSVIWGGSQPMGSTWDSCWINGGYLNRFIGERPKLEVL